MSSNPPSTHTARRRATLVATVAVFVIALIEGASALAYRAMTGEAFSYARVHAELAARGAGAARADLAQAGGDLVLHPYLGFVAHPEFAAKRWKSALYGHGISELGFVDMAPAIAPRRPDRVRIALLGGSVAALLGARGGTALERGLADSGAFGGRKIELVNLAMAGFKQPQTALALAYLVSLGGEFDAVINVDGFNDVALPGPDNVEQGIAAIYPREWANFAPAVLSPRRQLLIGRIAETGEWRRRWARRVDTVPLRYSVAVLTLWHAADARGAAQAAEFRAALRDAAAQDRGYQVRGPAHGYASEQEMATDLVDIWQRGSGLVQAIARAQGMIYVHFLQPNQYDAGAKPMDDAERAVAIRPGHPYSRGVELGYPRLSAAGQALAGAGVDFVDLRTMFAAEHRAVYEDDCCHLNALGTQLLAERVAAELARAARARRAVPR